MRFEKRWPIQCVAIAVILVLARAGILLAQGSGSSRATPSPPHQPTVEEFANSFWQYINRSQSPYQKWQTAEADVPPGVTDEHQRPRTTYLNDIAAKDQQKFPFGSIIVRPDYNPDGKTLQSVSVMYRVKATDPTKLDWYWMRFLPSGEIAKTAGEAVSRPLAGQVKSCIECHKQATGGDFVFTVNSVASEGRK